MYHHSLLIELYRIEIIYSIVGIELRTCLLIELYRIEIRNKLEVTSTFSTFNRTL